MGRQFVVQILFGFVCVVFGSCHEPTPSAEVPSMPDVSKPESVRNVDRKCGDQVDNFTARTRRPTQRALFGGGTHMKWAMVENSPLETAEKA